MSHAVIIGQRARRELEQDRWVQQGGFGWLLAIVESVREGCRMPYLLNAARLHRPRLLLAAAAIAFLVGAAWIALRSQVRHVAQNRPAHSEVKPALIVDHEVTSPVDTLDLPDALRQYRRAWIVLRRMGRPVAIVDAPAAHRAIAYGVAEALRSESVVNIVARIDEFGSLMPKADAGPTLTVTVAVCTRQRPDDLSRLLESLQKQSHQDFTLLVVDNAPTGSETKDVVDRHSDRFELFRYVVEPTPGLSQARNCALKCIDTDIVAWIDDDETADESWLADLISAFREHSDAAAVSGSVLPAELETWAQWWFEQYGGHTKGRGFVKEVFARGDTGGQSPLYPLPPFGVGANMAFRVDALREIGGFDTGLGAGTPTSGGEDVLVFSQLLLAGHTVVYEPAAATRHYHRRSLEELERQMHGYGVGLTAFYSALLRWDSRLVFPLIGLFPRALGDLSGRRNSAMTTGLPPDFPQGLVTLKRRGMMAGPWAYVRARRVAQRTGESS